MKKNIITSYKLTERGMMSVNEVDLLKKCAQRLPQNPIVFIIGAGVGTSTLAVLEECPDAIVFSFDISLESFQNEREVLVKAGIPVSQVIRVIGRSYNMGLRFPINADLVFVDGAHDNESVRRDIHAFLPKVKHGGYILFHDYEHGNLPDLTGIVDEAMKDHKRVGKARYLVAFEVCAD